MRNVLRFAFAAMLLTWFAACAQLGQPTPDTLNERIASGYAQVTGIRIATTNLVTSGAITPDDAENIQQQADNARAALDIARSIGATDPAQAENRLDAIVVALNALDAYLRSRQ